MILNRCSFGFRSSLCSTLRQCLISSKALSTTLVRWESPMSLLRKRTGFAFTLIKKALDLNENDVKKAENWLNKEAITQGWNKSIQLQDRLAAEGLIGLYIEPNNKSCVLLELNCETDFVARNDTFRELVSQLTKKIAAASQVKRDTDSVSNPIKKYYINSTELESFRELVSPAILKLGENIKLNRAILVYNAKHEGDDKIHLMGLAHSSSQQSPLLDDVHLGKYAAMIAMRTVDPSNQTIQPSEANAIEDGEEFEPPELNKLGKMLCQQIVGLRPKTLHKTEDQLEETEEKPPEENNPHADQDDVIKEKDEPTALLEQGFIFNDDYTVKEFVKRCNVNILDFERLECSNRGS